MQVKNHLTKRKENYVWCLVTNELITKLNDIKVQTEGFSDDLAMIIRGKFINILCDLLQSALNITSEWCDKKGLMSLFVCIPIEIFRPALIE